MGRTRLQTKVETVQKIVLSKQEAMAYLGVGEDYLEKLRNENEVVFSRKDRMIWYELESINRFLRRHRVN